MKRKRLYTKERGTWNKRGRAFSNEMHELICQVIEDHPDHDILDMEQIIVRSAAYAGTCFRLKFANRKKNKKKK